MVEHRLLLSTLLETSTATREDGGAVDRPKLHSDPLRQSLSALVQPCTGFTPRCDDCDGLP